MAPTFCKDCSIKISGFFKKKFTCQLCSNRFCDKCFSKVKENAQELKLNLNEMTGQNCLSCVVLQCSKIKREHLFLLENKQLAIYLTERCISTDKCSEKYHLVDLIMEFAERHGIKSGDDLENETLHRGHVEELKRKAELLRIQEQRNMEANNDEHEHEPSAPPPDVDVNVTVNVTEFYTEQAHFSGATVTETTFSNNTSESNTTKTSSNVTEPSVPDVNIETDSEEDTISEDSSNIDTPGDSNNQEEPATQPTPENESSTSGNSAPFLSPRHQSSGKWRSMEDIRMEEDINMLSVLELKQILTANFIDYRGCCEKKELIDKVTMLYQSQQASLDDKDDRDLCKICMDRTIDCIFLDCAHLVACTKCGKKLTECPICRALIVRVVHIFRA